MSRYTLNDMAFDPEPLTLFEGDPDYKADEEDLKSGFQRNRELMEQFRQEYKRKKQKNANG